LSNGMYNVKIAVYRMSILLSMEGLVQARVSLHA